MGLNIDKKDRRWTHRHTNVTLYTYFYEFVELYRGMKNRIRAKNRVNVIFGLSRSLKVKFNSASSSQGAYYIQ